jgi:cell division protein FtsN
MARDYAKKSTSRAESTKKVTRPTAKRGRQTQRNQTVNQGLLWMCAGLLIGLAIAGLIYLKQQSVVDKKQESKIAATQKTVKKPATRKNVTNEQPTQHQQSQRPQFEFYTILPSLVVDGDTPAQEAKLDLPKPTDNSIQEPAKQYYVQVASLRKRSDAESLRAQLALLGFEAKITPSQLDSVTWNRVFVGPYSSQSLATKVQSDLKQQGLQAIILNQN